MMMFSLFSTTPTSTPLLSRFQAGSEQQPRFGQAPSQPDSSDLVQARIDKLLQEKRHKPAIAYLRAKLEYNPSDDQTRTTLVSALTEYGQALFHDRKFRTAIPLLEEAWEHCNTPAESEACLHLLAQASAHAQQFRAAYQYASILHHLDPNTPIYQLLDLIKERKL